METTPTFSAYLVDNVGAKWVVSARMTPRIRDRYPGAVVITPKRYKEYEREYRALYGDPSDPVRAELYRALKAADAGLYALSTSHPLRVRIAAALAAEAAAR